MKRQLASLLAIIFLAGTASADNFDPIAERQKVMRDLAQHMRKLTPYARGHKPYDEAAVMEGLLALSGDALIFDLDVLFPVGTDVEVLFPEGASVGDTKASPKIWSDREGFQAQVDKFVTTIDEVVEAKPDSAEKLTPLLSGIISQCSSCHVSWRN